MKQTALDALHEARGAQWRDHHGQRIPACFSGLRDEYQALQQGAGLIDLSYRGRMLVTGPARHSWLHGQVTQNVGDLPEGRGVYATIITPQGQMVSDLRVFSLPHALLLDYPASAATPLPEYLDRYLIMERAELEDVSETMCLLSLQGPQSPGVVSAVLGPTAAPGPNEIRGVAHQGQTLWVTGARHCGEEGVDIFAPAAAAPALWSALCTFRREFAVHSVGWEALNVRRVEAGIPWWGEELDGTMNPLEARLEQAIDYNKGCYVGQEIIARIHARGHVNNLLTGFMIEGDALPARGTPIMREGKKVGRVSTALVSLALGKPIALGYLRRELQEPGTRILVGEEPGTPLQVTALPFVPHDYSGEAAE